jgi:hypothetical protein
VEHSFDLRRNEGSRRIDTVQGGHNGIHIELVIVHLPWRHDDKYVSERGYLDMHSVISACGLYGEDVWVEDCCLVPANKRVRVNLGTDRE